MKGKITIILFVLFSLPLCAQWVPQNSGVTENLNDVYCVTENIAIVVGNAGTLLKTTDGGENWVQKNAETAMNLTKVKFVNATNGYAVGENGTLLKTTDAGESWSFIDSGTNSNLYGLSVLNESVFYISGDNGLIKKTIDGGNSFTSQNIASTQTVQDIQYLNEGTGFALVGDASVYAQDKMLFKTTDQGNTWSVLVNEFVGAFFFVDENSGFISKINENLYKTVDGGMNLQEIGTSNIYETAIFSLDGNTVWDAGVNPALCFCNYYCITKRDFSQIPEEQSDNSCYEDSETYFPFEAIQFINETNGYAVGWNGRIYRNATGINELLGIDETAKQNAIKVYPNPTSEQITISFNETLNQPFSAEIIDSLGKKIYSKFFQVENSPIIDVRPFSKGVYFLTIVSQEKRQTQKIIIN